MTRASDLARVRRPLARAGVEARDVSVPGLADGLGDEVGELAAALAHLGDGLARFHDEQGLLLLLVCGDHRGAEGCLVARRMSRAAAVAYYPRP